jgi:hypothetical protein
MLDLAKSVPRLHGAVTAQRAIPTNFRFRVQFRWIALVMLGLAAWSLAASVVQPLSVRDLASKAQLIVQGTVVTKSTQRDADGRVYTKVELQLAEVWKGSPRSNPLTIVHGGGILGEERVVVSGQVEYQIDEEVVAFLVLNSRGEAVTLGLAQGKFQVWKDASSGKRCVHNQFHGSPPSLSRGAASSSFSPQRLTLDELKDRVKGERP